MNGLRSTVLAALLAWSGLCLTSCSHHTQNTSVIEDGRSGGEIARTTSMDDETISQVKTEWENEVLSASGSAPYIDKYPGQVARNKELARKGAMVDAKRNLAEKAGKVHIRGATTISDLVTTDYARSEFNAVLEEVEVTSEEFVGEGEDAVWKVTVEMPQTKLIKIVEDYWKR